MKRRLLRSDAGSSHVAGQWRKLSPSAELMVDPGRGARCATRDTGAPGTGHSHWTVTVLGEPDPMVSGGRTGDLAGPLGLAERALSAYAAGSGGAIHHRHPSGG
jgi:hypothetical protein